MAGRAIVDTGFLVALLNGSDEHHVWAAGLVPSLRGPWLTAEACISEAVFLLEQAGRVPVERLLRWLEDELRCPCWLPLDPALSPALDGDAQRTHEQCAVRVTERSTRECDDRFPALGLEAEGRDPARSVGRADGVVRGSVGADLEL